MARAWKERQLNWTNAYGLINDFGWNYYWQVRTKKANESTERDGFDFVSFSEAAFAVKR